MDFQASSACPHKPCSAASSSSSCACAEFVLASFHLPVLFGVALHFVRSQKHRGLSLIMSGSPLRRHVSPQFRQYCRPAYGLVFTEAHRGQSTVIASTNSAAISVISSFLPPLGLRWLNWLTGRGHVRLPRLWLSRPRYIFHKTS